MARLDSTTRTVLIGIGAAAAVGAGVLVYFLSSNDAQKKAKSRVNRERAKLFVGGKIGNGEKATSIVNQLTDSEINNFMSSVNETDELENKLSDTASDVSNFFDRKTKEAKKALK